MRRVVFALFFVVALGLAAPVQAQLRRELPARTSAVRVYSDGAGFLLNKLFSPEHFRMGHSYSMSVGGFGGSGTSSLGVYTNSMMWQFDQKLAARVDIGLAHSPFGGSAFRQQFGPNNPFGRVFLQNAEIAYRPSEHIQLNLSVRQSPYGAYMSPYGAYDPYYGYRGGFYDAGFRMSSGDELFWRADGR